jgi:hypothetical protein
LDRARALQLQHRNVFGCPPDRSSPQSLAQHSGHRMLNFRSGARVCRRKRPLSPALFQQYRTRPLLPTRQASAIFACIPPLARARLGWNLKIQPEEIQLGNRARCEMLQAVANACSENSVENRPMRERCFSRTGTPRHDLRLSDPWPRQMTADVCNW